MQYSEVESKRFGLRVLRESVDHIDAAGLAASLDREQADVLFLRLPSANQAELSRLERTGIPYLVADTLVYYHCDLADPPSDLRNPGLSLRQATPADREELATMVETIFPDYTNHYSANPLLSGDDILAGYVEWAESYIEAPGRKVFFAMRDATCVGFATCSYDGDECEGVLYGVMPEAAGQGVYTDIIRLTKANFRDDGFKRMRVSTQIQNVAVQKAWTREGFTIGTSYATVHLNPLFAASARPADVFDHVVDGDATEAFAAASGDRNPVHFDREYARSLGFEDRFAHGLIANGILSEYFGMRYPGPGTVIAGYRYTFMKPLYPGRTYRVRFGFPVIKPSGYHKATVTIRDGDELCLLAYCDLFKKPADG